MKKTTGCRKLSFFIDMEDVPRTTAQQKRVRFINGRPIFYNSNKLSGIKGFFEQEFFRRKPRTPFEGAIKLKVIYCFKASKTNKTGTYKTTRPDNDNLVKMLKDSLANAGFYKDDALVVVDNITKCFQNRAGIYIGLKEVPKEYDIEKDIRGWENE